MQSWNDVLGKVAGKAPVKTALTEDVLGLAADSVVPGPSAAQPVMENIPPYPEPPATPGDGNDPVSAVNHSADQHAQMRYHESLHVKLKQARDLLHQVGRDSRLLDNEQDLNPNGHDHYMQLANHLSDAYSSIDAAVGHLGKANKACLK